MRLSNDSLNGCLVCCRWSDFEIRQGKGRLRNKHDKAWSGRRSILRGTSPPQRSDTGRGDEQPELRHLAVRRSAAELVQWSRSLLQPWLRDRPAHGRAAQRRRPARLVGPGGERKQEIPYKLQSKQRVKEVFHMR